MGMTEFLLATDATRNPQVPRVGQGAIQKSWIANNGANLASGFNVTIPNGVTIAIFKSSAALASGTIVFPAAPADGMPLTIICPQGITLGTISLNAVQNISGTLLNLGLLVANTPLRFKWSAADSTWYPN